MIARGMLVTAAAGLAVGCGPRTIDEATHALREGFSGRILAVADGVAVYDESFGQVRVQPDDRLPRFRIGSITKTFTAAAIALLVEDGVMDLDAPLARHLDGFPEADRMTVRMLLAHRSGMGDFDQRDYETHLSRRVSLADMVELVAAKPRRFAPDTRYEYSNAGYVVLGHLIESVTGASYAEFLRERLLEPLGMYDTGFIALDADIPGLVPGHDSKARGEPFAYDHSMIASAGGLYSTAEDLVRWCAAFDRPGLLPGWYIEQPIAWKQGERFGRPVQWHTGNTNEYSGLLVDFRDEPSTCFVVLSNEGRRRMHPAINPLAELLFER